MIDWDGRPVLVTGGTGLIGSWLCGRLVELGAEVTAFADALTPGSHFARVDLLARVGLVLGRLEDLDAVDQAVSGARTIFHLGAQTLVGPARLDPAATFATNVAGTWNVLDAARRSGRAEQIVVASSDKAYGDAPTPTTEAAPLAGREPYEASKAAADLIAQSYRRTYDLPVVVARFGNVYGGGDLHWSRLVPGALRALLEGRRFEIRSDGRFTRDYVYVEDVVDGYLALANAADGRFEAYNLSDGPARSVLEVFAALAKTLGIESEPIIANTAVGEIRDQHLDDRRARAHIGWAPQVGFEEGLRRTATWYEPWRLATPAGTSPAPS